MKKKFYVRLETVFTKVVEIEADNSKEALDIACETKLDDATDTNDFQTNIDVFENEEDAYNYD